jgi:hypothetical protein
MIILFKLKNIFTGFADAIFMITRRNIIEISFIKLIFQVNLVIRKNIVKFEEKSKNSTLFFLS